MKVYGVKNQLYAKHQKKDVGRPKFMKNSFFSRVRNISGIDPLQGIHVVMELGYYDPDFIFSGSKILVYIVTSSVHSFTYTSFHSVVCPP